MVLVNKIWIYALCPAWSFIINVLYWIPRLNRLPKYSGMLKEMQAMSLPKVMSEFIWTKDKLKDWRPWPITIIARDLKDDCDGAAIMAQWWQKKHGIPSRFVYLYSITSSHVICVSNDNTWAVSNQEIIKLDPNNWKIDILSKYPEYDTIL